MNGIKPSITALLLVLALALMLAVFGCQSHDQHEIETTPIGVIFVPGPSTPNPLSIAPVSEPEIRLRIDPHTFQVEGRTNSKYFSCWEYMDFMGHWDCFRNDPRLLR